jgi:hypothetical protein
LQAAAAEVGDDAFLQRQAAHRGERAEVRLLAAAQQAHVRAIPLLQDFQQAIPVRGFPHRRRGHGHEPNRRAVRTEALEESADGGQRQIDGVARELAGTSASETGLDPLLLQDAVADAVIDPGQHEARRVGPEIQQREQLGHVPSVAKRVISVKSHVRYGVIHRRPPR